MKLWTIQTHGWLQELMTKKEKFASYSRVDHDWRPQYKWMAKQMAERIGTDQQKCPTFAWYQYFEKHRMPDLRWSCHLPRGTPGIRVELEVDEEQVLLSQFDMWNSVLNRDYISENEQDFQKYWVRRDAGKCTNKMIADSWTRIFDLRFGDWRWCGKRSERGIQACIGSVSIVQVRKIDFFIAR